jgi:hypothetical protein
MPLLQTVCSYMGRRFFVRKRSGRLREFRSFMSVCGASVFLQFLFGDGKIKISHTNTTMETGGNQHEIWRNALPADRF